MEYNLANELSLNHNFLIDLFNRSIIYLGLRGYTQVNYYLQLVILIKQEQKVKM